VHSFPSRRSGVFGNVPALLISAIIVCSVLLVPAALAHSGRLGHASTRAHGISRSAASKAQGTVTLLTDGSAADLDPATNELASSDMIVHNIDETLITFTGSSIKRFHGVLAQSWTVKNHGKTYVFHLRHGVRFHTGRCCMTASDVKYSLARTVNAALTNSYLLPRFIPKPSKQIKILNAYTVEFNLPKASEFFLPALANEYICLVLDSHALQKHVKGKDFGHSYASSHDLGTGPYTIQSWQRSQQVVLKAFPQYWGGWKGKHFSSVRITTVPESSTRRELIEKGQADLTFQLTPQDFQAMSKNSHLRVVAPYGTELAYIVMTQAGPLKSRYARQAMSYAFNYNAAIKVALRGYGRRAYGPIPSVLLGYDPHMFHYQTNLSKAKALLRKAGVKQGTTLTYTYSPGPLNEAAGRILQAQLQQIGLNLKLQQIDEATFNGIFYGSEPASKRPNFMPFAWWPDFDDPYDMSNILINSAMCGSAGANAGCYHDAKVDSLLKKMSAAGGSTLIRQAHQLQNMTGRVDPPSIWLAEPAEVTVMSRSLKGYVFNPLEIQTYYFYEMHR
jgi:peptide/nickel transport system substrate-binding protein